MFHWCILPNAFIRFLFLVCCGTVIFIAILWLEYSFLYDLLKKFNYRRISLLPVITKGMKSIITSNISKCFESTYTWQKVRIMKIPLEIFINLSPATETNLEVRGISFCLFLVKYWKHFLVGILRSKVWRTESFI